MNYPYALFWYESETGIEGMNRRQFRSLETCAKFLRSKGLKLARDPERENNYIAVNKATCTHWKRSWFSFGGLV